MLFSLAVIFLCALVLGGIFQKLKLPSLIGMLLTGILLGPQVFNLIDSSILDISGDLRQIALIIILTRAGLSLNINDLKRVGRPALLMCFVPASFEIIGTVLLAPRILDVSILEAAIIGCVIAAVSPAVIVPRMIRFLEEGYGVEKGIPQIILAGASVDDVYVIVLFTSFLSLAAEGKVSIGAFVGIPISILTGVSLGVILGYLLVRMFKRIHMRDSAKVIILLSIAFLLVVLEESIKGWIPFSGLLSIVGIGVTMLYFYPILAKRLSAKYSKLWVAAEILLFVLVGSTVNITYAMASGIKALVLLLGVLVFRLLGVALSLLGTQLNWKERVFCMIAYIPKATVQAAIGGIPFTMGLACGDIVLTIAVLSILIMAPLGALGIDYTYKRLLK